MAVKRATVPERFEYEVPWTTSGPDGLEVEVQLWATPSRSEAAIRILQGPMIGVVTDEGDLEPDEAAVECYGTDWIMEQLKYGQDLLEFRAGRS